MVRAVDENVVTPHEVRGESEVLPYAQEATAALQSCAEACLKAYAHLAERSVEQAKFASCMQCSEICMLTMSLLSQASPLSIGGCDFCIQACAWCAEQCSALPDEECQACATACKDCVDALRQTRPLTATSALDSRDAFGG
ncbi:MAG: hypothetical protein QM770_14160 [Tepidisphaeraceae bacterium]